MDTNKLIRMANQIAGFFRSYPEEQAIAGIRDHILAFWSPSMRSGLQVPRRDDGTMPGLDPLVTKALLSFQTGKSPIEKEVSGPEKVGQLGSDAG